MLHVLKGPADSAAALKALAWPSPSPPLPTLRSPMFVLPVFKGPNAFETFMVQCQPPLVLLTTLEEYKQ